ncbi:MAG: PaaI family thioesterase [Armatimonadota bacterium]|jgi:uncharacterized protein (TIGR00369 family)
MSDAEMIWTDDGWCMACGEHNPRGLHMEFRQEGEYYVCDFNPERYHQGWEGIVHGGILATLLDEAMNDMLSRNGEPVATAELCVRYKEPARVGVPLQIRAWMTRERPPLWEAAGDITDAGGRVVATGTAKLMRIRADI